MIDEAHALQAIGYLGAVLAQRADAWGGNTPDWFRSHPSGWTCGRRHWPPLGRRHD